MSRRKQSKPQQVHSPTDPSAIAAITEAAEQDSDLTKALSKEDETSKVERQLVESNTHCVSPSLRKEQSSDMSAIVSSGGDMAKSHQNLCTNFSAEDGEFPGETKSRTSESDNVDMEAIDDDITSPNSGM